MNRLKVEEVSRDLLISLAFNLSDADQKEVFLSTGDAPELVLMESVWISSWTRAVVDDEGDCVAIFGCAERDGVGVPWMLTSKKFLVHRREFARRCRKFIKHFYSAYPSLANFVHVEHREAIRWLSWCGFTVHEEVSNVGPFSSPFRIFTRNV